MRLMIPMLLIVPLLVLGEELCITVVGKFTCFGVPVVNMPVYLYDTDIVGSDDLMGTEFTNGTGEFRISGCDDEIGTIEPELRVKFGCKSSMAGLGYETQRTLTILLPQAYVGRRTGKRRVFNMRTVDLSTGSAVINYRGKQWDRTRRPDLK